MPPKAAPPKGGKAGKKGASAGSFPDPSEIADFSPWNTVKWYREHFMVDEAQGMSGKYEDPDGFFFVFVCLCVEMSE